MAHQLNGIDFIEGPGGGILTWHERPIQSSQYACTPLGVAYDSRQAIVMQGGIVTDLDFTLQTIELYRRLHPEAIIVLSTWADQPPELLHRALEIGSLVVTSEKPSYAGQQNVNLQIVSSSAGLSAAKNAGATHVLKTRTDQRLCATDILEYLQSIQKIFPLGLAGTQQQRLVAVSLNTFRYRMYGISDMFLYGQIDDMCTYWSPQLDERYFDPGEIHFRNLREFSLWRVCEVYFCTEFLQHTGWDIKWTLEDYWHLLADRFCVIDATSLDLFWPKYSTRENRWNNYGPESSNFTEVSFRDWTLMHVGLNLIKHIPEERLG
jgi:hypothetical protein